MKDPKQAAPDAASGQAEPAAAKKAERVQSSRYEWENKGADSEAPVPKSKAARSSLMAIFGARLRRFFSVGRNFFDKDDDATPSAA